MVEQHTLLKWTTLVVISVLSVSLNVSKDLFGAVKDGQLPRENKLKVIHLDATHVYRHHCAHCHGTEGKGDGKSFPMEINPKPRDFTDAEYMLKLKDIDIKKVIIEGSAAVKKSNLCPAWGDTFNDEMIKKLVAYVRAFSASPIEVKKPAEGAPNSPIAEAHSEKATSKKPFIVWPIIGLITAFLIWRALTEWRGQIFRGRS
jgi:cytochrome c553